MKNDAYRIARSTPDSAYAVPHCRPRKSPTARRRAVIYREEDCIPLREVNDRSFFAGRIRFCDHELAAFEVDPGTRKEDRELKGENVFTVEVLMQAIVVVLKVPKDERGWSSLSRSMTPAEELGMRRGIANVDTHFAVPAVCNGHQLWINRFAKILQDAWQRVLEVLVLATPKTMASHDDAGSVDIVLRIVRSEFCAVCGREQAAQNGRTVRIEATPDIGPIQGFYALARLPGVTLHFDGRHERFS